MQENIVEVERAQMTMKYCGYALHARFKGHRHTLGMFNNYCFSTATMVARTPLISTLYVHYLSCCSLQCTTLIVSALNRFLSQCMWNVV